MGAAVDGLRVSLDIEMPADALFGFEHVPSTDEEFATVRSGLDRMQAELGGAIELPAELGCRAEPVEIVEAPDTEAHDHGDEGEGEAHHDEADDHDHAHDEEGADHDHDHADEEDHDHDHSDGAVHSEVRFGVVLACQQSPEGASATLRFAQILPEVEHVDLTVITSGGQAAGRVDSGAAFRF